MSLSLVNSNVLTKNLNPYDLEQHNLATSLNRYSTEEVYRILVDRFQKNTVGSRLYNAIASFLCKDLPSLSHVQLIKVTEIYVKVDSTHSIFNKLFDFYEQHAKISLGEIVSLLVICQELESAEVKQPPNQVLVDFLRKLKSKLLNLLKVNEPFVQEMRKKLKSNEYSEVETAAVLDALLHLGAIYKEKPPLLAKCCQLAQFKYANRYDHCIDLYVKIYMLQASLLSQKKPVSKKKFYENDPLYKSNTSKIQWAVNDIKLEDIAALITKSVAGRIRDPSLLRTLSKRVFKILDTFSLDLDQIRLIIEIFEGYAQLNHNSPQLLDLCYRKVVCHRIVLDPADALRLLYGSAIFGLTGSSKSQVRDVVASINPYVNTVSPG